MKQRAYRRMRAHAFDWQIAQRAAMWRKASRVQRALFGSSRRRWRVGLPRYKAPDLIWFDETHAFDTLGFRHSVTGANQVTHLQTNPIEGA